MTYKWLKPMLPTLVPELPEGKDWVYEIKYDGYRSILYWSKDGMDMVSRNLKSFNATFPELKEGLLELNEKISPYLPLVFDGEICVLQSQGKASFEMIQQRGRLKSIKKIEEAARNSPVHYLAFDLLQVKGMDVNSHPYLERKQKLKEILKAVEIPNEIHKEPYYPLHYISFKDDPSSIRNEVKKWQSEGVVAKNATSRWLPGTRTKEWQKIKNWKVGTFILSAYEKENGYFHVAVTDDGKFIPMGLFSHGLEGEKREALIQILKQNKVEETKEWIRIKPGICIDLQFLELYKMQIRQPRFVQFRFDKHWEECTWQAVQKSAQS